MCSELGYFVLHSLISGLNDSAATLNYQSILYVY